VQASGRGEGIQGTAGGPAAQVLLDPQEDVFGKLLGVLVQLLHFRSDVRQLAPATHPVKLLATCLACAEHIFQTEADLGLRLQGLQRHVLQQIGRKPEHDAIW
jgi:hypothetical protein